jgi:hypothetical protein
VNIVDENGDYVAGTLYLRGSVERLGALDGEANMHRGAEERRILHQTGVFNIL